jgi:hypothetical protein
MKIPKGYFKLNNGRKIYITYSEYGHYPKEKGKLLMKEIIKQKPEYVLIEEHTNEDKDFLQKIKNRVLKTPEKKRADIDWAIIAAEDAKAKIVLFDISRKDYERNIYNSFKKYNKRFALIQYVSYHILNYLWHARNRKEKINWNQFYKATKKTINEFGHYEVKNIIKKEPINKIFKEWLQFNHYSKEQLKTLPTNYISALMYFGITFPSSFAREKYMIKTINKYSKKGNTVVVVGSGHISTWLQKKWIKK